MFLGGDYTENFAKAPPDKQQSVINAGFACFGRDGYEKTAMSEIAAKAGVSKASLFHYFGTKKELYLFLYQYACDEIIADIEEGGEDFFDCLRLGTIIKMRVMAKHPHMYDYLLSLVKEKDGTFIDELRDINNGEIERATGTLFANVDWSRFKPELDTVSAMELLGWVSEGCIRKYSETKTGEEIAGILDRYMSIMKKVLYKEEYL